MKKLSKTSKRSLSASMILCLGLAACKGEIRPSFPGFTPVDKKTETASKASSKEKPKDKTGEQSRSVPAASPKPEVCVLVETAQLEPVPAPSPSPSPVAPTPGTSPSPSPVQPSIIVDKTAIETEIAELKKKIRDDLDLRQKAFDYFMNADEPSGPREYLTKKGDEFAARIVSAENGEQALVVFKRTYAYAVHKDSGLRLGDPDARKLAWAMVQSPTGIILLSAHMKAFAFAMNLDHKGTRAALSFGESRAFADKVALQPKPLAAINTYIKAYLLASTTRADHGMGYGDPEAREFASAQSCIK